MTTLLRWDDLATEPFEHILVAASGPYGSKRMVAIVSLLTERIRYRIDSDIGKGEPCDSLGEAIKEYNETWPSM